MKFHPVFLWAKEDMNSSHKNTDMLHAPVVSMFFRYSLPWTLSFLLISSAGVVDGIFVGQYVGELALASLNIIWPVFSVVVGITIALASGGGVRCAAYLGKGDVVAAQGVYTKCMLAGLVFAVVIACSCYMFAEDFAGLLGADPTLLPNAVLYLQSISLFFPCMIMAYVTSYFLRVDERPNLASGGFVLGALLNIALDYLLVVHYPYGIVGAAMATGISNAMVMALYIVAYGFSKKPRRLAFIRNMGSWAEVFKSIWNGISEMINEMSSGLVIIIINITVMRLMGPMGVAAFTIISYVNWFCLMLAYGFSDSLSPLVSANHACKLHRRTRSLLYAGAASVFSICFICFLTMSFYPHVLISAFVQSQSEAVGFAEDFMYISRFMFFFCGLNIIITAFFTGLLAAGASALVAILRTLFFPILFLWILPPYLGANGVALALPLSEGLTFLVALYILYKKLPRAARIS